ncbi:type II toxin-antitoxin system VapB family antitoxin [Hansschlegelia sp. KR7-227]|uniref:type II toxin-antitoxin system VapB family antitoxin n=1 Tax=Hansschlegelia sp. KR7-227 TaxID=3400914 RepID=UPI003C0A3062
MAFHVRDPETDRVVRRLAARSGESLTATIRRACEAELARIDGPSDRARRLAAMQAIVDEIASHPDTGAVIDKAFFDSLNDE